LLRKSLYFEIHSLKVYTYHMLRYSRLGNFLVSMVIVCVHSIVVWFVMISDAGRFINYEEGRKYV
jgi:hypothetical protein